MHISIEMCQFGDYKLPLETIAGTSQGGGGAHTQPHPCICPAFKKTKMNSNPTFYF